jgi:hypothetical protein
MTYDSEGSGPGLIYVLSQHSIEGTEKNNEERSEDSRWPGRDSNPSLPAHNSRSSLFSFIILFQWSVSRYCVRVELPRAVTMNISLFWDATKGNRYIRANVSTLQMWATDLTESLLPIYQSTRRHISEDRILECRYFATAASFINNNVGTIHSSLPHTSSWGGA